MSKDIFGEEFNGNIGFEGKFGFCEKGTVFYGLVCEVFERWIWLGVLGGVIGVWYFGEIFIRPFVKVCMEKEFLGAEPPGGQGQGDLRGASFDR